MPSPEAFLVPGRRLAARLLEHPTPDRNDQSGVLGQRDEPVGSHDPAVREMPADQRLDPNHLGALELVDRLIEELELSARILNRGAQVGFQLGPVFFAHAHARVVEHETVLAGGLGGVEGEVGVAQQRVGVGVGTDRDPDADRTRGDLAPVVELDRLAQDLGEAVGEQVQRRLAVSQFAQHDELVAAEPADRVPLADRPPQPFSDGPQQLIPGRVAVVVVDVLEAVDVDEQGSGDGTQLGCRALDQLFGPVQDQRAVGEPGERVVQRLVGELAVLLRQLVGLLVHERQRAPAAGREHQHQQADDDAQEDAAEQHRERVRVGEDAGGRRRRERLHRPAVVQVDRGGLRVLGSVSAAEGDLRT